MSIEQAYRMPVLNLAFIGDTVCDLLIRTELIYTGKSVKDMHENAKDTVNAHAQACQLHKIMHLLENTEMDIVNRARNAHPARTITPSATREEYLKATGYEALMGFLFLTGQMLRAQKLFQLSRVEDDPCLKKNYTSK